MHTAILRDQLNELKGVGGVKKSAVQTKYKMRRKSRA